MTAPSTRVDTSEHYAWSKVPQVTLAFWIVKILATTVGETRGRRPLDDVQPGLRRQHGDLPRVLLTRPLGATLGDTLTKPVADGGLNFGRVTSSLVIAAGMILLIATTSLRKRATVGAEAAVH